MGAEGWIENKNNNAPDRWIMASPFVPSRVFKWSICPESYSSVFVPVSSTLFQPRVDTPPHSTSPLQIVDLDLNLKISFLKMSEITQTLGSKSFISWKHILKTHQLYCKKLLHVLIYLNTLIKRHWLCRPAVAPFFN